ncbi:hypothetical protein E2C01_082911 [Portunus trituberculatus]|uniref:Uncharacterized protein n=1 Tax=Portunus trituberculatus TaxID=210409 RepID=A0A5B7IVS7_PORTR|nr:hypothetical protein [Portunus trituberculatus]
MLVICMASNKWDKGMLKTLNRDVKHKPPQPHTAGAAVRPGRVHFICSHSTSIYADSSSSTGDIFLPQPSQIYQVRDKKIQVSC